MVLRQVLLILGTGLGLLGIAMSGAQAQQGMHGHNSGSHGFQGHDFHGRDFGHFDGREREIWSHGRWDRDWHDGRFGWWWMVDGGWYFYPEPIYPYPTYVPPAIVVQQPPPMPTGLPPMQFWYYCDNPQGYYPYVASCGGAWREIPANPPAGTVNPTAPQPGTGPAGNGPSDNSNGSPQ